MSHSASRSLPFPQLITRVCRFCYLLSTRCLLSSTLINSLLLEWLSFTSPVCNSFLSDLLLFCEIHTGNTEFTLLLAPLLHYHYLLCFLHKVQISHLPGIRPVKTYHCNLLLLNICTGIACHSLLSLYSCNNQPFTLGRTFTSFLSCEIGTFPRKVAQNVEVCCDVQYNTKCYTPHFVSENWTHVREGNVQLLLSTSSCIMSNKQL